MTLFTPKQLSPEQLYTTAPAVPTAGERQAGLMRKTQQFKQSSNRINAEGSMFHASLRNELLSGGNIYDNARRRLKNSPISNWTQAQTDLAEEFLSQKKGSDFNLPEELYGKKGTEKVKVASQSYYNDEIFADGYTRNAGGAPISVQTHVAEQIIEIGRTLQATEQEIATALAIARYESGFNPYAAAKSSSAYGVGQFIDRTGKGYGLNKDNKDDLGMQVQALMEHTMDNFDTVKRNNYSSAHVYALHHDGPGLDRDGLSKSREHVMPFIPKYLELVRGYQPNE